ncbi:hypothetical protein RBB50_010718 [Rhinocladiella similis]|jgi:hypothetical protein
MARLVSIFSIGAILLPSILGAVLPPRSETGNTTTCDDKLCTWWHENGEINTASVVQPGNVRQSRQYLVQVAKSGTENFFASFVYESIPRNGRGRIYSPWDSASQDTYPDGTDDGISIEVDAGINMAWSQFEYAMDVDVKIARRDGSALGPASGVVIRPSTIPYTLNSAEDGSIVVHVPYNNNGRRFSVEFDDDLYTYLSDGTQYVTSGGIMAGKEPRNALLIFASPFLSASLIPSINDSNTKVMTPGPINQGDWGSSAVLYFPPGVYWMNSNAQGEKPKMGENHIKLDSNTYWVYLAPGAFVKGAIEYNTNANEFYATGHGILSGEHYVYQANPMTYYQGLKSDQDSLRMWYHPSSTGNQKWHCVGPTISSPPFNTMDFREAPGSSAFPSIEIYDYKQVGAFFFQTDGPAMYSGSNVHDVFYHVNDDAIKTYYSNVKIAHATVWKVHNDPVIQMGWDVRDVNDVQIDTLNVIHTRYIKSEMGVPSAIIGASPAYSSGVEPDTTRSISMTITNLMCEGSCPGLFRLTPLESYKHFVVQNVAFPDGLRNDSIGVGQSIIETLDSAQMQLEIKNWTVGGQKVTMQNFQTLAHFDIDASYWGQWSIE